MNSGKTMTFYERSELFRKYPKTPVFDHSNYRLFERIHVVPGTSNNRGLTVCLLRLFPENKVLSKISEFTVKPLHELQKVYTPGL